MLLLPLLTIWRLEVVLSVTRVRVVPPGPKSWLGVPVFTFEELPSLCCCCNKVSLKDAAEKELSDGVDENPNS